MDQRGLKLFERADFAIDPGIAYRGAAYDRWHILFLHSGGFEEACGDHAIRLKSGQVRISCAGSSHALRVDDQETRCTNLHVSDPASIRRLERLFVSDHTVINPAEDVDDLLDCAGLELEERLLALVPAIERQLRGEDPRAAQWLEHARNELARGEVGVAEIAERYRVSREHFARRYKHAFGCSPQQTRGYAALRHARFLIEATDMPLREVALEAGYFDQGHMSQSIRRKLGATPLQLRRAA